MKNEDLIIEQEFNANIELVWRAFTEPELIAKWLFEMHDFKPEVGCKFYFEGGADGKRYMHLCEVLEVIPLEKLKYSWTYEDEVGYSAVTVELKSIGDKTKVTLTHEGLASFVNPDFKRSNFVGGWNYLIHESLKAFLENGEELRTW